MPMTQIPLFPLNTVLFPGVPLNLHIFEARYQKMIRYCLSRSEPFGVVLIRKGGEALGPIAEPHEVGCSATIMETEPLGDGRINIAAVGIDRFQILSLNYDQPYLVGEVEKYPFTGRNDEVLGKLADELRPWVSRYLRFIADTLPEEIEAQYIPDEPEALAYIAAFLVQAPAKEKQILLEKQSIPDMLSYLIDVYRRETALIQSLISGEGPVESGFGLN
jgi:Lon protease-like protein